ncbi:hypothetical protein PMAYCL1PPCAC_24060 [Pristionchus mayeri]|uniref:ZP domain-containing protein n=1 Tax=Pristionchus mayeri TaxID=1317129 RepID=A0AAN5I7B1_9BILA|nr:hypothetical protein PMAYCL1PPCAC_24060 [Pristionchus mayeri]
MLLSLIFLSLIPISQALPNLLDNGVAGLPEVDCMEDRLRLHFNTQRPFNGRIYVRGMVDKPHCVKSFSGASASKISFDLMNGECNMRRARRLGPDQRGIEQSITVIISFHNTFITKVDRAFRTTCFYMEADKVVTSRFDVSQLPTTDLIDTAKMPLCTYSVRRDSITGPVVQYAVVGETVFHVWQCESDMFSMLVHSCFVDDGAGQDKKPILDENGCSIDPLIVPDLTYNPQNNLAYSEVSVFKFADKVTTYFQCAVSTCMVAEGMCVGKTPPRCGGSSSSSVGFPSLRLVRSADSPIANKTRVHGRLHLDNTMDLAADKIVVLDIEESPSDSFPQDNEMRAHLIAKQLVRSRDEVCIGPHVVSLLTAVVAFSFILSGSLIYFIITKQRDALSSKTSM